MGTHQNSRRRKTIAVENRGREPWQDRPDTRTGGSFDTAVVELEDEFEKGTRNR